MKKKNICFHIPISQQGERRFKEKPNVLQPQQILYDLNKQKVQYGMKTVRQKNAKPLSEGHNTKAITLKQFLLAMIIIITIPVNFFLAPETNH